MLKMLSNLEIKLTFLEFENGEYSINICKHEQIGLSRFRYRFIDTTLFICNLVCSFNRFVKAKCLGLLLL